MQTSVHRPDITILRRLVFWIAARKFGSSHEFIELRSIGAGLPRAASTCGQVFPENDLVSTDESTTGTPNTRAAFASATLLLTIDWRSWLPTPNSIWG